MHAHFGDPLVIDANYFNRLASGKIGTACQEGYRVFDLDNPTIVNDISGTKLGEARVKRTIHTKISDLDKGDIRLVKAAGFKSKEEIIRTLKIIYDKEEIEWITFARFVPVLKLVNRAHPKPKPKEEEERPKEQKNNL